MPDKADKRITLDLALLDRNIRGQDWPAAWQTALAFLKANDGPKRIAAAGKIFEAGNDQDEHAKIQVFFKELGARIWLLLTTPQIPIPDSCFLDIVLYHRTLHSILPLAGHGKTDDKIKELGLLQDYKKNPLSCKRLLLLLNLKTKTDLKKILREADIAYAAPALIGYLSAQNVFGRQEHKNKVALLQMGGLLNKWPVSTPILAAMAAPYIMCSYENSKHRHDIKPFINKCFERAITDYMRRNKNRPAKMATPAHKKTLMVIAETYQKDHVLPRMWHKRLAGFKDRFHTVLMTEQGRLDESYRDDFDAIVEMTPDRLDLAVGAILAYAPDIIFYPSIGMAAWCLLLSNYRFADLQVMSLGTAASAKNPHIDFVIGTEDVYSPQAFPGEKYIVEETSRAFVPPSTLDKALKNRAPLKNKTPKDKIKIGVVCMLAKFTCDFKETIKTILARADFETELVFLSPTSAVDYIYCKEELEKEFAGTSFTFYGMQPYEDYFRCLQDIDIFLNPFPFGHANTLVDILLSGKPCVGLLGTEPFSRMEYRILKHFGLEDMFLAKTREEYIALFFKLAGKIRAGKALFYDRDAIPRKFFDSEIKNTHPEIMMWLLENKDTLKKAPSGTIRPPADILSDAEPVKQRA